MLKNSINSLPASQLPLPSISSSTGAPELTEAGLKAVRPKGDAYTISDDRSVLEFYYAHKEDSAKDLVHAVCSNTDFWGKDLTEIPGFEEEVARILEYIEKNGTYNEMKAVLSH